MSAGRHGPGMRRNSRLHLTGFPWSPRLYLPGLGTLRYARLNRSTRLYLPGLAGYTGLHLAGLSAGLHARLDLAGQGWFYRMNLLLRR